MKHLRIGFLIYIVLCCSQTLSGQSFDIPEGKFDIYWETSFLEKCRKSSSELPFKIETIENSCQIRMEYGNLFSHVAVPFILDGDTSLLSYNKIEKDEDSGEILTKYTKWFDFEAIGMFEYKGYWVIIYSYPLADPNKYQSYTINTYSKDGKRIDRLPFFKWECKRLSIMDISWFEMTGYIDENFEITIQSQGSWDDVNTGIYKGNELKEKMKQNYLVYHINDNGEFELVKKKPSYFVNDKNDWTKSE